MKHLLQTLTGLACPNLGRGTLLDEHLAQNTFPQFLQWCRLFTTVKLAPQLMHLGASTSGIQTGGRSWTTQWLISGSWATEECKLAKSSRKDAYL